MRAGKGMQPYGNCVLSLGAQLRFLVWVETSLEQGR